MDYKDECENLITTMSDNGWHVIKIDLGDDDIVRPSSFSETIENMTACDEYYVWLSKTDGDKSGKVRCQIVLGNSPGELLSDYAMTTNSDADLKKDFDKVIESIYQSYFI